MPNTYTQLHVQCVFAVKYRECLIREEIRPGVEKFITGVVHSFNHKLLSIYAMPDHVHLLAGMNPKGSIADMMREVKSRSSAWINKERLVRGHFQWQEGYGAFSYAKSEVPRVIQYILNQPTHHRKKTFREEYQQMLKVHGIAFDARYLFEWI